MKVSVNAYCHVNNVDAGMPHARAGFNGILPWVHESFTQALSLTIKQGFVDELPGSGHLFLMLIHHPRVTPSMLAKHALPSLPEFVPDPWEPVPAVTDWNWFLEFVARGGDTSRKRFDHWIERRSRLYQDWPDRFEEFKRFRHEKLYLLKPSDFDSAKRPMGREHSLGKLDKNQIDHSLSSDFSPPIPFIYPFHLLLEEKGRIPAWSEVWDFLVSKRPDLMMRPYAAYNGLSTTDPVFKESRYREAFQWRLGLVFYSWYREIHLLTELRCVHRLDVRFHLAADAEWKADLIGGDVLLELFILNEAYKTGDDEGRKETCATANLWAKTIRFGFANRRLWGRPYLLEEHEIENIARQMAEAGCPKLP